MDSRNALEAAAGGSAVHGITKFSDLTDEEFASTFLGFKASTATGALNKKSAITEDQRVSAASVIAAHETVDWYLTHTTEVRNQGYCGSCWAFSAAEQIESDSIRAGLLTTSDTLSPEQIVECAPVTDSCFGCDGGYPSGAYEYISSIGGIQSDSSYPYDSYYGQTSTCSASTSEFVVTVTDYTTLSSEDEMITYVASTGPLSVCLDASSWSSYTSGVVSVCGMDLDHCVQVTGINTADNYWIVRNSWGTDWGDEGFIYLSAGSDMCGISYIPTYTTVASV